MVSDPSARTFYSQRVETYQIILFGLLAWLGAGTVVNILVFPTVRRSRDGEARRAGGGKDPLVSVLVPARNEEANIGGCVRSLMAQDDPNFEVLVLDDRSEDATVAVLRDAGFAVGEDSPSARFRVLAGEPLPAGWAGKPWACQQLARAAKGDWLLFTDADTTHQVDSVRAAVESSLRANAGLLSVWPRQIMGSWAERAVLPLLYLLTHTLLPQSLVAVLQRWPVQARLVGPAALAGLGAANGQFMLFRRDVYDAIGGHAAVANHLVEDVALGRLIMARTGRGMRLINADGRGVVTCRMYHDFRGVWDGFSKNLRPVFGTNLPAFMASGLVQVALFIAPFVFAVLPLPGQIWALGQVVVVLGIRFLLAWRFGTGFAVVLWHPFAYLLAMVIALNSWRWSIRGTLRWKGRTYPA